ncbi:MAG: MerR family transcriptional regulator [Rhodothermales bacterium]|nr:MerR family transcriptional regulator [Rhodothermales bacterium]MBO6781452.1 MerR family transcriptional regulator [Rhodothermales bacterium]
MLGDGITKLYYTIGEVGSLVGEETHVLRYWETEFPQLKPRKNRAGNRVYTNEDIDLVFRIRRLLREDKYTLEGARQQLDRGEASALMTAADRRDLKDLRTFLVRLLDRIK